MTIASELDPAPSASRPLSPSRPVPSPPARRRTTAVALRQLRAWLAETRGHGVWILIWSVVSWVATASSPMLLDRPLLLMALAPRAPFVLLAAPSVDIVTFVIVGTIRLSISDANWWIVGRRFPDLTLLGRTGDDRPARWPWIRATVAVTNRMIRWLAGRRPAAGLVLFLRPNGKWIGFGGAYGVGPWTAGISAVAGTVTYLVLVHQGLGFVLG